MAGLYKALLVGESVILPLAGPHALKHIFSFSING